MLVDITKVGRGPWRVSQRFLRDPEGKRRSIGWDVWQPTKEVPPPPPNLYVIAARGSSTKRQAVAVAAALNALDREGEK